LRTEIPEEMGEFNFLAKRGYRILLQKKDGKLLFLLIAEINQTATERILRKRKEFGKN